VEPQCLTLRLRVVKQHVAQRRDRSGLSYSDIFMGIEGPKTSIEDLESQEAKAEETLARIPGAVPRAVGHIHRNSECL